jgi:tRNA (guanine10-N2)-dimethyltransferase
LASSSSPCLEGSKPSRAFFILSGEHASLPRAEVKALLEAQGGAWRVLEEGASFIRVEAPLKHCVEAARRAAMVNECCQELAACRAELEEALEAVRSLDWSWLGRRSFAVRVEKKGAGPWAFSSMELERAVGAAIGRAWPEAKVDLKLPDVMVRVLAVEGRMLIGIRLVKAERRRFEERRPRRRPFFHPSALEAKLARLYVNLARAKPGDALLDPFSGTGGILVEAFMVGCFPLGIDVDPTMAAGAKENVKAFKGCAGLIVGDARKPPVHRVDCIATDPPYGKASSTHGLSAAELMASFLPAAAEVLPKGGHLCLAVPSWVEVEELASSAGFSLVERHELRVHGSLTRVIAVLKR